MSDAQPTRTTRRERIELALTSALALVALLACSFSTGDDVKVSVECKGGSEDIACDVSHTAGESTVEACWDIQFKCENGEKVKGSGCAEVDKGETVTKRIPISELENHAACDKVADTKVKNLKLKAAD